MSTFLPNVSSFGPDVSSLVREVSSRRLHVFTVSPGLMGLERKRKGAPEALSVWASRQDRESQVGSMGGRGGW